VATLADLFNQIQQQTTAKYGGASWWPAYQQAWSGGKEALAQWMTNEAPKYSDWTPDAAAFASKELAMQQEHTRNLAGINVEQSTADKIGHVAGIGGKIGAAMGVAGAAYLGAGALGAAGAGGGMSAADAATLGGMTEGAGVGAGAGLAGEAGAGTLAGTAGADTLGAGTAASAGPGEWADLSSWLGADATGAPAYDATEAALNSSLIAGAGGSTSGAIGGASAGAGTAATAAGGGTALSRIFGGNGGAADYAELLARFAPAAFGAYGANQQANAYRDLGEKYLAVGAPSRARFESSFAPGFTMENEAGYKDALAQTTKATLHGLSVNGNRSKFTKCVGSNALSDVNSKFAFPALNEYRRVNAGAGGLAALTSAAPAADSSAVNANKSVYDALGAGAADIFSPARSLSDLLREMKRAGY
jgi:hypothetical protein